MSPPVKWPELYSAALRVRGRMHRAQNCASALLIAGLVTLRSRPNEPVSLRQSGHVPTKHYIWSPATLRPSAENATKVVEGNTPEVCRRRRADYVAVGGVGFAASRANT